jgi:two-component sensor histidine kinase
MMAVLGNCPAEDEIVLCLSELTSNAVQHSASADPGGTFSVLTKINPGAGVFLEIRDDGGPWTPDRDDGHMHGLGIVRSLAASMSISGNAATGWIVNAWFGWHPASSCTSADQSPPVI